MLPFTFFSSAGSSSLDRSFADRFENMPRPDRSMSAGDRTISSYDRSMHTIDRTLSPYDRSMLAHTRSVPGGHDRYLG